MLGEEVEITNKGDELRQEKQRTRWRKRERVRRIKTKIGRVIAQNEYNIHQNTEYAGSISF